MTVLCEASLLGAKNITTKNKINIAAWETQAKTCVFFSRHVITKSQLLLHFVLNDSGLLLLPFSHTKSDPLKKKLIATEELL